MPKPLSFSSSFFWCNVAFVSITDQTNIFIILSLSSLNLGNVGLKLNYMCLCMVFCTNKEIEKMKTCVKAATVQRFDLGADNM